MSADPPRRRRAAPRTSSGAGAASAQRNAVVWQADLAPVAIRIDDTPDARPALLLVMCNGFIITGDVNVHPPSESADVAAALAAGIGAAIAKAGSGPDIIEVRHAAVAKALGKVLGKGGPAVAAVPQLPDIDDALAGFDRSVGGRGAELGPRPHLSHPDTWAGWGLGTDLIGRLFAAAAAFYRAAPWTHITNDDVVRLSFDDGRAPCCTVMGHARELFGLALYERAEDLMAILSTELPPEDAHSVVKGPVFSLSFSPRDDVSPKARTEVTWARWELAHPEAWPDLLALNTPGGGITAQQMETLIAALRAIARFAKKHAATLRDRYYEGFLLEWRDQKAGVTVIFDRPEW